MKTKYAIHDFKFTDLRPGDEESIGEVILRYTNAYNAIPMINYYREYGYRIVWDIKREEMEYLSIGDNYKELQELSTVYENMSFRLPFPNIIFAQELDNVFFGTDYAASTYQEALTLYHFGVEACYVTGTLASNIEELKKLSHLMEIRIVPNLVQTDACFFGNPGGSDPLQCFWLRPESIHLYDGIVQTFEFATDDNHLEIGLLHIYAARTWDGKLGDIIIDETKTLNYVENFYEVSIDKERTRCGLSCQKDDRCHLCQHILFQANFRETIAEKLEKLKTNEISPKEELLA